MSAAVSRRDSSSSSWKSSNHYHHDMEEGMVDEGDDRSQSSFRKRPFPESSPAAQWSKSELGSRYDHRSRSNDDRRMHRRPATDWDNSGPYPYPAKDPQRSFPDRQNWNTTPLPPSRGIGSRFEPAPHVRAKQEQTKMTGTRQAPCNHGFQQQSRRPAGEQQTQQHARKNEPTNRGRFGGELSPDAKGRTDRPFHLPERLQERPFHRLQQNQQQQRWDDRQGNSSSLHRRDDRDVNFFPAERHLTDRDRNGHHSMETNRDRSNSGNKSSYRGDGRWFGDRWQEPREDQSRERFGRQVEEGSKTRQFSRNGDPPHPARDYEHNFRGHSNGRLPQETNVPATRYGRGGVEGDHFQEASRSQEQRPLPDRHYGNRNVREESTKYSGYEGAADTTTSGRRIAHQERREHTDRMPPSSYESDTQVGRPAPAYEAPSAHQQFSTATTSRPQYRHGQRGESGKLGDGRPRGPFLPSNRCSPNDVRSAQRGASGVKQLESGWRGTDNPLQQNPHVSNDSWSEGRSSPPRKRWRSDEPTESRGFPQNSVAGRHGDRRFHASSSIHGTEKTLTNALGTHVKRTPELAHIRLVPSKEQPLQSATTIPSSKKPIDAKPSNGRPVDVSKSMTTEVPRASIPMRWLKPAPKAKKPMAQVTSTPKGAMSSGTIARIPRKVDRSASTDSSGKIAHPSSPHSNRMVTDSEGGSTVSNLREVPTSQNEALSKNDQRIPDAIVTNKSKTKPEAMFMESPTSNMSETKKSSKKRKKVLEEELFVDEESDSDVELESDDDESSEDSETDDGEVFRWASKMFGTPAHSPETKRKEETQERTNSQRKALNLKLKIPPKQNTAATSTDTDKIMRLKMKLQKRMEEKKLKDAPTVANSPTKLKQRGRKKKSGAVLLPLPQDTEEFDEEKDRLEREEEKRVRQEAKALTSSEIQDILGDEDFGDCPCGSNWVRRSTRQPSKALVNAKPVKDLVDKLKRNDPDMAVLKMKKYINDPNAPSAVLDEALDALEENTNCEALYIQNFNEGMRDKQVLRLVRIMQQPSSRIWCLNIGENYNVETETWEKFTKGLRKTKVTHMYASEHTITSEMKDEIRVTIRENRKKHNMHIDPDNLNVIVQCTHCWWNPVNAKSLQPYLKKRGYEHILKDKEVQGLKGSTSDAPSS